MGLYLDNISVQRFSEGSYGRIEETHRVTDHATPSLGRQLATVAMRPDCGIVDHHLFA